MVGSDGSRVGGGACVGHDSHTIQNDLRKKSNIGVCGERCGDIVCVAGGDLRCTVYRGAALPCFLDIMPRASETMVVRYGTALSLTAEYREAVDTLTVRPEVIMPPSQGGRTPPPAPPTAASAIPIAGFSRGITGAEVPPRPIPAVTAAATAAISITASIPRAFFRLAIPF